MMGRIQFKKINRQGGISLLEVLLSLTIVIILLVMATRYFLVANMNQKINNTISEVSGFQAAVSQWMTSPGAVYTGATLQAMYDAGMVPQQLVVLGTDGKTVTSAVNPWGGTPPTWLPSASGVTFTISGIPADACTNLAAKYVNDPNTTAPACNNGTLTYTFK